MDALIIAIVNKLAAWSVGKPFFAQVLSLVSIMDGRFDLDGDGKKEAVLVELSKAGVLFGKRQFNRANFLITKKDSATGTVTTVATMQFAAGSSRVCRPANGYRRTGGYGAVAGGV